MSKSAAAEKPQETEAVEQEVPTKAPPIMESRFGLEVEASNHYRINVPQGTPPEALMDEAYWQHVAYKLRPGDTLRCMPDNMAWELNLQVIGSGRLYAHVVKKTFYELTPLEQAIKLPSIYKIRFLGSHHKWGVERDGNPLKDGFETEALAQRYAQNHEAAVKR